MNANLKKRITKLETVRDRPMKDVRDMTDAKLLDILAPVFGGREPVDGHDLETARVRDCNLETALYDTTTGDYFRAPLP